MFIPIKSYSDPKHDFILFVDINLDFAFIQVRVNKSLHNSVDAASAVKRISVSGVWIITLLIV